MMLTRKSSRILATAVIIAAMALLFVICNTSTAFAYEVSYPDYQDAAALVDGQTVSAELDLQENDSDDFTDGLWFKFDAAEDAVYTIDFGIENNQNCIDSSYTVVGMFDDESITSSDAIHSDGQPNPWNGDEVFDLYDSTLDSFGGHFESKAGKTYYFYVYVPNNYIDWPTSPTYVNATLKSHKAHDFEIKKLRNFIEYTCPIDGIGYTIYLQSHETHEYNGGYPYFGWDISWNTDDAWGYDIPKGSIEAGELLDWEITRTTVGKGFCKLIFKDPFNKWIDDVSVPFTVTARNLKEHAKDITVSNVTYTGSTVYPSIKIFLRNEYDFGTDDKVIETPIYEKLVKGKDYKVTSISAKGVGKASITIKGIGNYKGTITKTFTINPKKAAISSLTPGKGKLAVKMSTKVSATGGKTYQINYKVKGATTWKSTTTPYQTKTIKNLKKGKKYQVRVRAYKTVSGKKYYGAWSKTKTSAQVK